LYKTIKNYDKALIDYNKAIELDADNLYGGLSYFLNKRGLIYQKNLKNFDKALADFNSAIKFSEKDDKTSYYYRADLYVKMNDFEKAIADCELTIKMSKKNPEGYYKLALVYNSQDRFNKSITQVTKSITLFEIMDDGEYIINSEDYSYELYISDLYHYKSSLFNKIGNKDLMCEDYNTALSLADDPEKKQEIELLISENCKN